ncbi:hypothetical protein HDU97_002153 [Phlyctochytrium planicorne]|nr:hypothetical protein HDU97_002153 [Phlyctochytrium planicorne]
MQDADSVEKAPVTEFEASLADSLSASETAVGAGGGEAVYDKGEFEFEVSEKDLAEDDLVVKAESGSDNHIERRFNPLKKEDQKRMKDKLITTVCNFNRFRNNLYCVAWRAMHRNYFQEFKNIFVPESQPIQQASVRAAMCKEHYITMLCWDLFKPARCASNGKYVSKKNDCRDNGKYKPKKEPVKVDHKVDKLETVEKVQRPGRVQLLNSNS